MLLPDKIIICLWPKCLHPCHGDFSHRQKMYVIDKRISVIDRNVSVIDRSISVIDRNISVADRRKFVNDTINIIYWQKFKNSSQTFYRQTFCSVSKVWTRITKTSHIFNKYSISIYHVWKLYLVKRCAFFVRRSQT